MNALFPTPARPLWPNTDGSRTPYRVFTDQEIHDLEQEKIYRGKTWNFLALEAELPKVGDYKSTYVGDTPVVVTRAEDGTFAAWVNRCAHRGAKVCRFNRGNATSHQCVYHQWSYDTKGDLQGVPFRRGFKGQPGMPESFDMKEHGLQKLRVETYDGIVFGTFRHDMESLHDYLGAEMRPWIDRVCGNGKKLVYLGCLRQFANSNWKLYYENVKDPYHASLLHLFHVTFNIARVGMAARSMVDARHGMHSCLTVTKNKESENADSYKANNVSSYNENVRLQDMEVLRMREEFDEPITNHIQTIFPSLVIQQIHNTLACRQVLPKGPGKFELVFHLFGYEDDDEELRAMRLLQSNLIGPAGFISMEDTEATELVQAAITPDPDHESAMFMGHGAGAIYSTRAASLLELEPGCDRLMIRLDREVVERVAGAVLGHPPSRPIEFAPHLQGGSTAYLRWWGLVQHVLAELARDAHAWDAPLVRTSLEQMLAATLLQYQPNDALPGSGFTPTAAAPPRRVRRVMDWIAAHAHEPVTLDDVAAIAGCGLSALYAGFRDTLGTTPMAYLRDIRLERVRAELRAADPAACRVTEVATRWGFFHFGRFAGAYKRRFGELPRDTLRR